MGSSTKLDSMIRPWPQVQELRASWKKVFVPANHRILTFDSNNRRASEPVMASRFLYRKSVIEPVRLPSTCGLRVARLTDGVRGQCSYLMPRRS